MKIEQGDFAMFNKRDDDSPYWRLMRGAWCRVIPCDCEISDDNKPCVHFIYHRSGKPTWNPAELVWEHCEMRARAES
jgi:hypothetical protein